jgi:hypothetical protein
MPFKHLGSIVSGLGLQPHASPKGSPMKRALLCAVLAAPVLVSSPALWAEDAWDRAGSSDDSALSQNELAPGSSQVHDMEATGGIPDEDWYRISMKPLSSYEVVVDGPTAGMGNIPVTNMFDELAVDLMNGSSVWGSATSLGASGAARVLSFRTPSNVDFDLRIRVSSPACNNTCGANQQYTIRFLDTTYSVSRFNNSATQVTFLIIQNTSYRTVAFTAYFSDPSASLVGVFDASLPAQGSIIVNTSLISAGKNGSIIVTHNGRYGALAGKAVSIEATTGFTFDTALVPRPQ